MRVHQRLDDSRPRGLASECICGRPGCTQWYADQMGVPVRVSLPSPQLALSSTWRERHPRLAAALVAFGDVLGTGLLALAVYVWLVYLR